MLFPVSDFFLKMHVKLIDCHRNELIPIGRKLYSDPTNIFRLGSKPESLQTHTIPLENTNLGQ